MIMSFQMILFVSIILIADDGETALDVPAHLRSTQVF